jgi:hypothetical protein
MRTRQEILKEYKPDSEHILEVLLDIRDVLIKETKKERKVKNVNPNNKNRKQTIQ